MPQAQDAVSFPIDAYPVRPGTSAALTARTIDATVHPPLIRAQEKVVELIPRLAAPLESPLLLVSLAGTLAFLWMAKRAKLRPVGILLPAALMVTLTSFRPAATDPSVSPPQSPEPAPFVFEAPEAPEPPEPPPRRTPRFVRQRDHSGDQKERDHSGDEGLISQLIESYPEMLIVAKLNAELLAQDERQVRRYVKELRHRLRAEARRMARDR